MTQVDDLKIQARRAEARGDYARASGLYLRAVSASEEDDLLPDAGLLIRVGDLEYRQGDHEGALTYYRRAVEVYAEQGLLANAVAVCNKVLRVFPEQEGMYARLAELHLDMGLVAEARRHLLHLDEAVEEREEGDERVRETLRSYLEREPDQELALRLARRLEAREEPEKALSALRRTWWARTRDGLEVEALESAAREIDPDVDFEEWAKPPIQVHDGRGGDGAGEGEDPEAATPGADLGELGVLDELREEAVSAREGDGRGGEADGEIPLAGSGSRDEAQIGVLQTLARLVEYRDFKAERHAERVGEMAGRLGEELGLGEDAVALLRDAAPLHDIGMVVVPDQILLKEGDLTDGERKVMVTHAANGARILAESDLPVMRLASEIAHTHHERWDGEGYPREMAGEEIPVSGRIVAVADTFEAITHDRPFREAESVEDAVEEIRRGRGTQFDPRVVDALLRIREAADDPDGTLGTPGELAVR
jgi:putative two-component system response regulator